tara:strand:+ start:34 stop:282 length:249 start_codon:yes stop_codon:yes gene_type:complete
MKTFNELYGDGEFRSSRGVREPVLQYTEPEENAQVLNFALDNLKLALERANNPERYVAKFSRSLPGLIDNIERITKSLEKMR